LIGSNPEARHPGYQRIVTASFPVFICISDPGHNQYDENDCAYSKNKFHGDPFINYLHLTLFTEIRSKEVL